MINFTFANPSISDFFEKSGPPPISELLYLHDHPLVKPNFINQLETMMSSMGTEIQKRGLSGKVIEDLSKIALNIGTQIHHLDKSNAGHVLLEMKKAYEIGKQLGIFITG